MTSVAPLPPSAQRAKRVSVCLAIVAQAKDGKILEVGSFLCGIAQLGMFRLCGLHSWGCFARCALRNCTARGCLVAGLHSSKCPHGCVSFVATSLRRMTLDWDSGFLVLATDMDDTVERPDQERMSECIVEPVVCVTVAHVMEDIVDVAKQIVPGHGDGSNGAENCVHGTCLVTASSLS